MIDLSPHYNAVFQDDWNNRAWRGNNLSTLSCGLERTHVASRCNYSRAPGRIRIRKAKSRASTSFPP